VESKEEPSGKNNISNADKAKKHPVVATTVEVVQQEEIGLEAVKPLVPNATPKQALVKKPVITLLKGQQEDESNQNLHRLLLKSKVKIDNCP
jgi:hypothetical protein